MNDDTLIGELAPFFSRWRHMQLGDRDVVEALVMASDAGPSPSLAAALGRWPGYSYWVNDSEGRWLVLSRERIRARERWWLHLLLFTVALLTTSHAGSLLLGGPPATSWWPDLHSLVAGLPFSMPLMAILVAHESGHYVLARKYRVNASPPYFIPFPAQLNIVGTMGAFIRVRSPIFDRRTLFDIGAAGPFAGIVVAIPVLVIGLSLSHVIPNAPARMFGHQLIIVQGTPLFLSDSLLLRALRAIVVPRGVLLLHPVAVAGWMGVLVTMLNLLPLAQLDGGHIIYALAGDAQKWVARIFWLALLPLGFLWYGWWLWAVLALALGRGRLTHPYVIEPTRPLGARRRLMALLAIFLFALTFMPNPVTG